MEMSVESKNKLTKLNPYLRTVYVEFDGIPALGECFESANRFSNKKATFKTSQHCGKRKRKDEEKVLQGFQILDSERDARGWTGFMKATSI